MNGKPVERRIVGGLLANWSVWTKRAVELLQNVNSSRLGGVIGEGLRHAPTPLFSTPPTICGCIADCTKFFGDRDCSKGFWCLDPREG